MANDGCRQWKGLWLFTRALIRDCQCLSRKSYSSFISIYSSQRYPLLPIVYGLGLLSFSSRKILFSIPGGDF